MTNTPASDTTAVSDDTAVPDDTAEAESTVETDPQTDDASAEGSDVGRLEQEGDIAADYLEELLDIADLDGDLDMDVEGDRAAVSIVGGELRQLVGREGEVLEALQELTRLAVYRETGERSRLMLDIGGYRADKRTRLEGSHARPLRRSETPGSRRRSSRCRRSSARWSTTWWPTPG